jgi:ERCC4-related helicase
VFTAGQRVRNRHTGEVGVVERRITHSGRTRFLVVFPGGPWEVRPADLVAIYDDPFELLSQPLRVNPYRAWLRREAFRLADAYRNDPTAALSNSRIEPKEHQISVALRALEKPQARLIVADEVGLGKTIEAGLVLKELRARGVLGRVHIITPASLLTQWKTELRSKFNEVFTLYDGFTLRELRERHPDANPWNVRDEENVICSLQFARGKGERDDIAAAEWDLVIVDEAHHARRTWDDGPNLGYQLLEALRDRVGGMLLLTATPMQLHDYELYSMVELVEPGLFDDYYHFVEARDEIAEINEHFAWLRLGVGRKTQRQALAELLQEWEAPSEVRHQDVKTATGREAICAWLEQRHLLSQALVRNRKAEVGGFMRREAHRLPVEATEEELELEHDVQDYLRRQYRRSPALGLVLVTFQKLLASSTRALANAIDSRIDKLVKKEEKELQTLTDDPELAEETDQLAWAKAVDLDDEVRELRALAARARAISDTKLDVLDEELTQLFTVQKGQKVLIFTQYLGTLEMIRERLADRFRVVTFHGGMTRQEKEAAHRRFKADAQVMVSSEAGGEGRNFQFCHILFNYDLPWNPMRIEQRIGRLDRVGQKRNVLIYNFGVRGTLDERILDVLENRIKVFSESVGALEPILGELEERIKRIVLQDATTAQREFRQYELDLDERLRRARRKEEQMRDFVMDAQSFRRDEVERLLHEHEPMATSDELRAFVVAAFRYYPSAVVRDEGGDVVTFELPGVLLQRDRDLHESYRGTFNFRAALDDESLDFFAFGHPLVDLLVDVATEDGAISPVAALEGDSPPGYLVDYHARFSGVRDQEQLITLALGCQATSPAQPADAMSEVTLDELSGEERSSLEEQSRRQIDEEVDDRFGMFSERNDATFHAERARLEKRFAFQARFFEQRIERVENQISRLLRFGTEAERQIIPALRGRIDQERLRIAAVGEERSTSLASLDERRQPSHALRLLGITRVVPQGQLTGEKGAIPGREAQTR